MDPVELAKQLQSIAKEMLASAVKGGTELVPGLYETSDRLRKALYDLETAIAANATTRKAAGLRATDPKNIHAASKRRAQELLKAGGGG